MTTARAAAITMLRAVADLIEANPDRPVPVPAIGMNFFRAVMTYPPSFSAIAAGLPCRWSASILRTGQSEMLQLHNGSYSDDRGARVTITAPLADTCVKAGTRTVTA